MKQLFVRRLAALTAALVLSIGWGADVAHASEPCNPPNVIPQPVCDMDSFYGAPPRQLPVGWNAFVLSGEPNYYQDDHTFFGGPNLTMASNGGTFKAGIYTQAQVTPGSGYRASISWGAPNKPDLFGRQLGIDPTGGTDPNAPTVIWGPMHWGEGRILNYPPPDVNIDVKARALGETMTVFFLTDHPQSGGDDIILIDAIALYPDDSAPAVELPPTPAPTDTPTPEPPPAAAAAPVVEQRAALPTETPTPTPLPTETPLPTATPTATPSPTPTNTPTPLPTATWTPLPPAPAPDAPAFGSVQSGALTVLQAAPRRGMLFVAIVGFGSATLLAGAWLWLRKSAW
jgi:hypothetical protein